MSQLNLASIPDMKLKSSATGDYSVLDISSIGDKTKKISDVKGMSTGGNVAAEGAKQMAKVVGEDTEAGGVMGGAGQGAQMGAMLGPKGAIAGAVIGGIAGGLSARSKRKERERQADAEMYSKQGAIHQNQGMAKSSILSGLANNLSRTLV